MYVGDIGWSAGWQLMAEAKELLEKRAEEQGGGDEGLYYTDKQQRVLRAIVENPEKNTNQIGRIADVHPSYVTYIIKRLPPDKATDWDWLRRKAGMESEEASPTEAQTPDEAPTAGGQADETSGAVSGSSFGIGKADATEARNRGMTAGPDEEGPPPLSPKEVDVAASGTSIRSVSLAEDAEEIDADGYTFSVTRRVPMRITFTIPQDFIGESREDVLRRAAREIEN